MNKSCYRFQKITFSNGLLQNCVDATYVIHLENNGRYENIITQLDKFPITKMNFILLNKGYLNCKKDEYIDTPPKDLVDSYLTIFKHANQQKYRNILILEDDYFFNEEINLVVSFFVVVLVEFLKLSSQDEKSQFLFSSQL